MTRKIIISFTILIMAFIVGVSFILNSDNGNQEYAFSRNDVEDNKILRSSSATPVYLYFADRNKPFLKTEERVLNNPENPILFGKVIVDALIKGPQNGLMRTVPVGTVLRALYITKDKTAYADFSQEISEYHPGGIQLEYLTIYSIVNSLALNIPKIEKVKILIEGQEQKTLAGHIDLHLPFSANMLIVR
jgi:spore germination protein GerM